MEERQLIKTARVAGVWYLILAISGVLGFMIFHSQIFVSNDPQKTLTNLTNLESTSRITDNSEDLQERTALLL